MDTPDSFFIFIVPEINAEKMIIPRPFVYRIRALDTNVVILRDRYKNTWQVRVSQAECDWFFDNGWRKFYQENKLEWGDNLLFRYKGDNIFDFKLLGGNACEEKGNCYLLRVKVEEEEEEEDNLNGDDDDDDDEYEYEGEDPKVKEEEIDEGVKVNEEEMDDDDDFNDDDDGDDEYEYEGEDPKVKEEEIDEDEDVKVNEEEMDDEDEDEYEYEDLKVKEEEIDEDAKVNEEEMEEEEENDDEEEEEDEGEDEDTSDEEEYEDGEEDEDDIKPESRLHLGKRKLNMGNTSGVPTTTCKRMQNIAPYCYGPEIFESGLVPRPTNPYFVTRSRKERRKNELLIPKSVIEDYNLNLPEKLFLVDKKGNQWETKVMRRKDGRVCLSRGWRGLCVMNNIKWDDACICEFVQRENVAGRDLLVYAVNSIDK